MLCVTLKALLSAPWVGFQCLALGGWEQWNVCLKWILSQSKHRSCSSLSFPPVICLPNLLQTHSLSGGTLQQGPHANGSAAICSDPNWRSIISSWCQGHLCHLCKHTVESADNCHIEAFAKTACRVKSDACHNVLLMNHKLGKISERSKQYGQSFLHGHERECVRPHSLCSLPRPEVETPSHIRRTSACTDSPPPRSLVELKFH